MESELEKLIDEYKEYCDTETEKVAADPDNPLAGVSFTFDGFYYWLKERNGGKKK